jgi:hypothetical protein
VPEYNPKRQIRRKNSPKISMTGKTIYLSNLHARATSSCILEHFAVAATSSSNKRKFVQLNHQSPSIVIEINERADNFKKKNENNVQRK